MDTEPTCSRTKRQKTDKTGRLSALEKLKQLKGNKHKYEIEELENVYEEVDEEEYSKTVLHRQNDDWIIDDGKSGYIEDGREIFDDDLDTDSIQKAMKEKVFGPKKKKKDDTKKKGSIQNMFINMSSKKKTNDVLEEDNILDDLMCELKKDETIRRSNTTNIRNKFSKKQCIKDKTDEKSCMLNTETLMIQNISKIHKDDDICNSESIYDKAIIKNTKKDTKNKDVNESENNAFLRGTDQNIDATSSNSQYTISTVNSCSSTEDVSKSQIIDNDSEDLSKYMEDMSDTDFENSNSKLENSIIRKNEECMQNEYSTKYRNLEISNNNGNEIFNDMWNNAFETQIPDVELSIDNTEIPLPLITDSNGEKIFRFYWWDAYEDAYKQPGIVYMFGKVYVQSLKTYCSCCLTIKNIPRRIYLLPRKYIKNKAIEQNGEPKLTDINDVYKEFNEFANKTGIKEFRCSRVTKQYAFEQKDTPLSCEYLEIRYSARYPAMDSDYSGPAIECVFGTSVKALELLLTEGKIKGPCWLDVQQPLPTGVRISWCKVNVNCMKMENITVSIESQNLSIPPMIIAALNVRVSLNTKLQQNEVIMVVVFLYHKYCIDKEPPKAQFTQKICLISNPHDTPWPRQAREKLSKISYTKIIKCENENDLYEKLLNIIHRADPDLLIGYDCGFQFDVLMHRIFQLKVANWSRIGRLKRSTPPIIKGKINLGQIFVGRPMCDIQVSAKELNLKVRSYDLHSLCVAVLNKKENEGKEINPGECSLFYSTVEKIEYLIKLTLTDTLHILSIVFELNIMPLALQITCLAGNILSRTLSAGRAERNEYLLLHAFHQKNYITPDKRNTKYNTNANTDNSRKKKSAYTGGLVLDPKKGFYNTLILLMDFNSLYPSIIQEYNLCFTTVTGAAYANVEDLTIPQSGLEPGVIPTEIRKLVESRIEIKKLMKTPNITPELKMQYNIRQLALKLTANSMYGCLGATHCRFYAKGLAALITSKGREILQDTKHLVERLNYQVIYGDTDSIMINTNILEYDEVFSIGKKIKQEVNKVYKRVELDIDGVFRYLLLLQKKKYAAVTMTKLSNGTIQLTQEHKGLDIVRRDWCQLACETGKKILDQLLSDRSNDTQIEEIFIILQNVSKDLKEGNTSLSSLVITKQLSKNPHEYPDKKQSHVMVALRLNKEGGRMWKVGDTVPYIICEDGTDKSAAERSYHIDEFKKSTSLKIDINYYLLNQVFPVVLRLCEPIEGIDDVLLAENLGLKDIYKSKRQVHEQDTVNLPLALNEDKFRYCLPLKFKCKNQKCQTEVIIKNIISKFDIGDRLALSMCPNTECKVPLWKDFKAIQNEIYLTLRYQINEYYSGQLECENPLCLNKTRRLPLGFSNKYPECFQCTDAYMHKLFSDIKLYNQKCFYLHIFDVNQLQHKSLLNNCPREMIFAYDTLKETVEKIMRWNAYGTVNLTKIFSYGRPKLLTEKNTNKNSNYDQSSSSDTEDSDDELILDITQH